MDRQNSTLSLPRETLFKSAVLCRVKRNTSRLKAAVSGLLARVLQGLVEQKDAYSRARERHLRWLERGMDLGMRGQVATRRDELHERG